MIKKRNPFPVAAILFVLCLVSNVIWSYPVYRAFSDGYRAISASILEHWIMRVFYNYSSGYFEGVLWVLPCIFLIMLCIALFIKRRNVFLVIAIALQSIELFLNFLRLMVNVVRYPTGYDLGYIVVYLILLSCVLVAVLLAVVNIQKKSGPSKVAGVFNKLWFLPGVLYCVGILLARTTNLLLPYSYYKTWRHFVAGCIPHILPAVAWLMLGLWFKQCWKAEVAEAQDAYKPVYISEAPIYEEPVYVAPVPTAPAPVEVAPVAPAPAAAPQKTTDELREYKKLLDDGVITQEEFDAKKKQLLGL